MPSVLLLIFFLARTVALSALPVLRGATVARTGLVAIILALTACSGDRSPVAPGDPTGAESSSGADPFAALSTECQSPLARELATISIHANDPLMQKNLALATRCGNEMLEQFRQDNPVTKADRVIAPLEGLINFESPHVHPIDLTPDGNTLVAVNTAGHRLEIWRVDGSALIPLGSVPVGLDPVSVRVRGNAQAWVVNHISDSVSIVDLVNQTVVRTLLTDNEPADVIFAAAGRAFVSASEANVLNVFDTSDLDAAPQRVAIDGEDPRALAVSADGLTVYAAIFESGNGTRHNGNAFSGNGEIVRDNQQADNDVAIIDAVSLSVSYRRRLMNMVMALDVHPTTGRVHVVGTEAFNDIPNEPALNGRFVQVQQADFSGAGLSGASIVDLNPHLDYSTPTVSQALRDLSLGDPRGIAWRNNGQQAFVTGMGSNNLVVIDSAGNRLGQFDVGQGPTGIVLNDAAGIGFVMNKFAGSVSVVDLDARQVLDEVAFDDPTPAAIKAGRPFLYDTRLTSGTGHLSCASCHVDARTDRLGWQLSDGQDISSTVPRANNSIPGQVVGTSTISSNKHVMTTQTLVDIMEHPRFHWRGDRASIDDFNGTFVNLMGRESQLSQVQMDAMKDFLRTLWLPPNPYRTIRNTRPSTLTLPDGSTVTSNRVVSTRTDALRGGGNSNNCLSCHSGQGNATRNFGANPEISSNIIAPALPALYDKMGFTFGRTGFGFFHHGGADLFEASRTREFLAEILTLEGPEGPLTGGEIRQAPHAGVGQQVTIGQNPDAQQLERLDLLNDIANQSDWAELVAHVRTGGVPRGFLLQSGQTFAADITGQTLTRAQVLALADAGSPVTFTLVAAGTGTRLALDRNLDGVLNNDVDTDGDGLIDLLDADDDNDGVPDTRDAFPLDPAESVDTDGDGIGNNADPDDDNDGVLDADDLDPLDPDVGSGGGGGDTRCNLLTDGGFELGTGDWYSNTTLQVVNPGHRGNGAVQFSGGYLGQTFDASAGTQYTFSGYYQSSGATGWAGFGLDFIDANGDEVGELVRTLAVTGSWTSFSLDAPIPAQAVFIRPWFYAGDGRTVRLDDLDLRQTGCSDSNTGNEPPFVANPGNQAGAIGDAVNLTINALDPDGDAMTFSATNLPAGLSIAPGTGVISGVLQADGASNVTVFADDGEQSGQASFIWTVSDPGGGGNCNLLNNGSFEFGLSGWSSSVTPAVVNDAAVGSSAARWAGGWISLTVPGAANTNYSFTGQYRAADGSGWAGYGIDYLDGAGNEIGESVQTLNASAGYAPFALNITSPVQTASIRIWFYADADREVTLDAVDLREAGCSGGGGGNGNACNQIPNSDFENNTSGWFTNTAPVLTEDAASGNRAVQISGGWFTSVTPVVPGEAYTATAQVKSAGTSGWAGAGIDFVDGNGNKLDDVAQTVNPTDTYGPLALTATAPAGAVNAQFWFFADPPRTLNLDAATISAASCGGG